MAKLENKKMIESIEICDRFDKYFDRGISEWPEILEIKNIVFTANDKSLFLAGNMYNIYDEISGKYIGSDEEVFMTHIHRCIFLRMHNAAQFMSVIRPKDLRRSEVRDIFEKTLRTLSKEQGWDDQDFAAIDAYFAEK